MERYLDDLVWSTVRGHASGYHHAEQLKETLLGQTRYSFLDCAEYLANHWGIIL